MKETIAKCPGSCGELIQGFINDDFCLVSNGINLWSTVSLTEKTGISKFNLGNKATKVLELAANFFNITCEELANLTVEIDSELSLSKGMASSTADMAAVIYALGKHFNKNVSEEDIAYLCTQVESTDSVFFKTMTLMDLKKAKVIQTAKWQPEYFVLMLEPESVLETIVFHTENRQKQFRAQTRSFNKVYTKYLEAIKEKNLDKLGEAATTSARLNQSILSKPFFDEIIALKKDYSTIFGINVAHSGTVIGILLKDLSQESDIRKKLEQMEISSFYTKIHSYQSYFNGLQG